MQREPDHLLRSYSIHCSTCGVSCDHRWTTFRALLYYFYTNRFVVTEPASNYVVHLNPVSSERTNTSRIETPSHEPAEEEQCVPSRRSWLLQRYKESHQSPFDYEPVQPASRHALYRLADKVDILEAKELAKRAIVDGFTIDNVCLSQLLSGTAESPTTFSFRRFCTSSCRRSRITTSRCKISLSHSRSRTGSASLLFLHV